jgi:hypothetical protein
MRGLASLIEPNKWYALQLDPLANARLLQVVRHQRVDVVHFGNAQFLTLGLLPVLRPLGIRTVVSVYDYWLFCPLTTLIRREQEICRQQQGMGCFPCLPATHRAQRALLAMRPRVIKLLSSSIDRFVVLSESSRRIAERNGIPSERIRVIRLPREPRADDVTR